MEKLVETAAPGFADEMGLVHFIGVFSGCVEHPTIFELNIYTHEIVGSRHMEPPTPPMS